MTLLVREGIELPASVARFLQATLAGDGDAAAEAMGEAFEVAVPSAPVVTDPQHLRAGVAAFPRHWHDASIEVVRLVGSAPHLALVYVMRMAPAGVPEEAVEVSVTVFVRLDEAGAITSWREQFDHAILRRAVQAAARRRDA